MSCFANVGKSLKSEQFKDEYHIMEIENEIKAIEPIYDSMATELEQSPAMAKYVNEINRIWDALKKSYTSAKALSELVKDNLATISSFNLKVTAAGEANESDQKLITKLQQEVERALRMVDTAHTREQVAQETVENLRQQILRLHQELEQKTKSLEQDGEYSSIAKNKEALMKERERMTHEIAVLKEKLQSSSAYQEELERKNSQADLRVAELTQELENQSNEMSKEARFKERFEDDLMQVKKELVDRELEITQLNSQLAEYHRSMAIQQNMIKEQKNLSDKLNQSIETHQQRILKLGDDLQREVAIVEMCNQKINVLEKQLKLKDDMVNKLILELTKTSKVQDSFKTKLNRMEAVKNEIATQKKKLQTEIEGLQRNIDNDKRAMDIEKRKVEDLTREKEIISKSSLKTASMLDEQLRLFKIQEQARFHLEQELDTNRYEVSRQVQELLAMEKEKDRYIGETVVLTKKVEATLEDVRLKQSENYEYRKRLAVVETQLANKHNQCEALRYELNTCSKNLLEAQDDISDLKQKAKVTTLQIEQLKGDIAGKETQLIREQLALRKAHGEKEAMRVEIQKFKDQLDQAKEQIKQLNTDIESMNNVLRKVELDRERDRKEKEKIMNEKDILSTQLVRRNDEVVLLREKVKIFQSTMDKEDLHYSQRLEDIRLLKLEVQRLNNEKNVLTKSLDNMVDLRVEVHHLEKNLTKERLKSRALEDEQLNPLNVHRWRKLEGSDPEVHELVQKVNLQQRRILEQTKLMVQLQEKYNSLEKQYHQSLLISKNPLSEDPVEVQRECKIKENKIKGLTAEISMRESQAVEYKAEIEKLKQELVDYKKKFYEQKQKTEKLGQKLEASKVSKPEITVSQSKLSNETEISMNKHQLPALSQKPRFTGGGFNMGVAAS